jgi:hypothetical protein
MRKPKAVRVDWEDSVGFGGWHVPHETDEFCKDPGPIVHTVGYVERKTKRHLVLAMSVHGKNVDHLLAIPWSAIKRVRRI